MLSDCFKWLRYFLYWKMINWLLEAAGVIEFKKAGTTLAENLANRASGGNIFSP